MISDVTPFVTHVFCLFMGIVLGLCVASDHWRQTVVDKGYAEWQIVKGTKEVEFKWKENQ